ncbi:methyltransferase domain-containing protein [Micromonospora sp. WMMD812]|uniref:class I SAM-dependent methyltransferase n=1 Tax=Micromonospora sp. WMMD812 TaxID=3015152 RepID=UPI00248BD6CA|nr:methyltransferase domain-containing protein [Micromonospora sp. WMMD812]WBB68498.1 methyltransferase domain-containing protein [Micromonospora sp. WMMD812]
MAASDRQGRLRRYWDRQAPTYDRQMSFADRRLFRDTRPWIAAKAVGDVLEVAVGTGLNLPYYPSQARLTAVEWSPRMLALARHRAAELGRDVDLRLGDAQALDFPDASFDTVVCTFSLCAIPDERRALGEMSRVLRPGGLLLLADHVPATAWPLRLGQRLAEVVSVPLGGEHFLRRPADQVRGWGWAVEGHDRFARGVIERLAARKPPVADTAPAR